jgi:hypothetical protein
VLILIGIIGFQLLLGLFPTGPKIDFLN